MSGTKRRSFYADRYPYSESEDGGKTWSKPLPLRENMGAQVTESEGHPRNRKGFYDSGGPFYTARMERSIPTTHLSLKATSKPNRLIKGDFGTPMRDTIIPTKYRYTAPEQARSKDTSDLDQFGATAISLVAPTNPNVNLGTTLAELHREGIPSLPGIQTWKRRTEIVRAAASEFLNAEFGWLPLVSEVKDTASMVKHSKEILTQYHRDEGRNVRREFSFPIEESENSENIGEFYAGDFSFPGFWAPVFGPAMVNQTVKVRSRKWFSGSFTYAIPSRGDAWEGAYSNGSDAGHLLGTALTPDVLWELTPWSWAVDWFTNVGDIVNNVNNFVAQGLVMRYGYMMEESSVEITNTFISGPKTSYFDITSLPPSSKIITTKVRRPANPFGFGITTSGLSATQVAIAVALGIVLV